MVLLGLLLSAFSPMTIPVPSNQYETNRHEGYQVCFARLAGVSKSVSIDLAKSGHTAGDVCRCVGDRFATMYVAQPLDEGQLVDVANRKDGPISEAFASLFAACAK